MYRYVKSSKDVLDDYDIVVRILLEPETDSQGNIVYSSEYYEQEIVGYSKFDAPKFPLSDKGEQLNAQLRADLNDFLDDCESAIVESGFQIITQFDSLVSRKSRYFVIIFGEPGKEKCELGFEICITDHQADRSIPKEVEEQFNSDPRIKEIKDRDDLGYVNLKLKEIILGGKSFPKREQTKYTWQDGLDVLETKLDECKHRVDKLRRRRLNNS